MGEATQEAAAPFTAAELEGGVDEVRRSPRGRGSVELIVVRPDVDRRTVVPEGRFDVLRGLVGDTWSTRPSSRLGYPDPEAQVTLMNARAAALVAGTRERWPLAGDQLYVDLDLSGVALPAGSRLRVGTAVLEVTPKPHTGCAKFSERFGSEARRFVNSTVGRELNLRGINARVLEAGVVQRGSDIVLLP